jgi:hypothetical protein
MKSWKRRKHMNHWPNLCPWVWYTYGFYHIADGMGRRNWRALYEEPIVYG